MYPRPRANHQIQASAERMREIAGWGKHRRQHPTGFGRELARKKIHPRLMSAIVAVHESGVHRAGDGSSQTCVAVAAADDARQEYAVVAAPDHEQPGGVVPNAENDHGEYENEVSPPHFPAHQWRAERRHSRESRTKATCASVSRRSTELWTERVWRSFQVA